MNKNKIYFFGAYLVRIMVASSLLMLVLTRCEIQPDFEYQHSYTDPNLNMTAWEYIQQQDSLSFLKEAITATGLQDMYSGADKKTFIAPRNSAFRDYLTTNNYSSISDIPVPILKNILLYHIIPQKILFTDSTFYTVNFPVAFETENGQQMYLSRNNNYQGVINQGTNQSWTIVTSNLEPTNGAIHISPALVYYSAVTGTTDITNPSLETDTIYATQDTYINGGTKADQNFGSDILIKVKDVDGAGDYDRRTFLMFDLKDITKTGNLRQAFVDVGVNFTHGKGLRLSLYDVPDTTWSETSMTWNNAPASDPNEISHLITSKVSVFSWDCSDYVAGKLQNPGKISIKIDGEPGGNETNDLISKENPKNVPPMLICVFSSGNSNLAMGTNTGFSVENGGSAVLKSSELEMSGAAPADIIYTLESAPSNGWLIMGTQTLTDGSKFTQLDIDTGNIVYVHSGTSSADDSFTVSVEDRDGGSINPFDVAITVQ
ncbi:DNRLRE domain-containing protein [Prolixibacter sp. NT017]|uniref:CBM96 family carbohydrate-binding protein n=1 Tax=Prolixibacter sp. NT017 TaxID=2652390 RepID=UPI001277450D|nr:DNRLRE domain-containing protein [Prolixibacter sp. NT017]GET25400.1 hypothetical protein NT017_17290 [Prolixibacter sp. NT017]